MRAPGGMLVSWGSAWRGNRIETRAAPGMTTDNAAKGEPAAPDSAVHPQRLDRIERAGRGKAAAMRQHGREQITVEQHEPLECQAQRAVEGGEAGADEAAPAETGGAADPDGPAALAWALVNSAMAERNVASRSA